MRIILLILILFQIGIAQSQTHSPYITIDQFGYLPGADKVAVIRKPIVGYDAGASFNPGTSYSVIDVETGEAVFSGSPVVWNGGSTDTSSGDRAWWFDFSTVTSPGTYYVLDVSQNVKSYDFEISGAVYNNVLKHAMRTFFYQRAGFAKERPFADQGWTDAASHLGPLQDKNCRKYDLSTTESTERDLSGGWYDAGDYNKYTNWNADYVTIMMLAYLERPEAWADDYNIPESGNGIPDLIDEAKWGLDHLLRMQEDDGSVLSIVGLSHASPPSSATGPSLYGSASTSASLNTSGAFAISAKVFAMVGMNDYATTLQEAAVAAWDWAELNPNVLFYNNDAGSGTSGLGAGQQETNDYGRLMAKLEAATFLFEQTGDKKYQDFFNQNYEMGNIFQNGFASPFETKDYDFMLYYANLPNATVSVANDIKTTFGNAMNGSTNLGAYYAHTDPYRAYLKDYTWGSNGVKSDQANMFIDLDVYNVDPSKVNDAYKNAEGFIHYIHGVNPFNMVYLTNMYAYGGDNCANEIYHTWFANGHPDWDRVGESTYGPPPGYVPGGPNPSYQWDGCCPDNCGGASNNAICNSESLTPPENQPAQKSYKDFNTSWPLNSWQITENHDNYQIKYIRLLSKFVDLSYDCNGDLDGDAIIDVCGRCAGGNTGLEPETDISACEGSPVGLENSRWNDNIKVYPNPSSTVLSISFHENRGYKAEIIDLNGNVLICKEGKGTSLTFNISRLNQGEFLIKLSFENEEITRKFIKQ